MKLLKTVFGFCWALWGGFWFMLIIATFTVIYAILFFFTGKRYVRACIWINCRYLANAHRMLSGVRRTIHGREHIDPTKAYVFVANHTTQYDTIVAATCVPHAVSFIAKSELKRIPFFGAMVSMLAFPVDRKDKASREQSYRFMADELERGHSLFLFPEGTRNRTCEPLIEFKNGAFKTAIMSQTPIAVLTMVGMRRINEAKGLQLFPGHVDAYFSKTIDTKGMTLDDVESLKDKVRAEMLRHLV